MIEFKCNHCRSEFVRTGIVQNVCDNCARIFSRYGKPCSLCKVNAAINTDKCLRCKSNIKRFGQSYKRALTKAMNNDEKQRERAKKRFADDAGTSMELRSQRTSKTSTSEIPEKIAKTDSADAQSQQLSNNAAAINQMREHITQLLANCAQISQFLMTMLEATNQM